MTAQPIFDIRKSVPERNLEYIIITAILALCLILVGRWMIPAAFVWELSINVLEAWNGWAFVGLILIASGLIYLFKAIIRALRFIGTTGEWHFRLTYDELLWDVPKHSFGPEIGFVSKLSNIKEIEFRTITEFEQSDVRQYWIHFKDREPVQLMDYTGYTISALVLKIHEAGVSYKETTIDK